MLLRVHLLGPLLLALIGMISGRFETRYYPGSNCGIGTAIRDGIRQRKADNILEQTLRWLLTPLFIAARKR
jgi:hypothetical protein